MDRQEYIDKLFETVITKTDDFAGLLNLLRDSQDELVKPINCLNVLILDIKNDLTNLCEKLRNE